MKYISSALSSLLPGKSAIIKKIMDTVPHPVRFCDLGLISGTPVQKLFTAPSGNPSAYLVRGAVIAIRDEDAVHIAVEDT